MFFKELQTFSERLFKKLKLPVTTSPWYGQKWTTPAGAIIHYTAHADPRRAVRWFVDPRYSSGVSAHVVVACNWPDGWKELASGLPLVEALPAAVVQCVLPDLAGNHATWVNPTHYGVELANAGQLVKRDGAFYTWPNNWTELWSPEVPKTPAYSDGHWWEPYTDEQIGAAVTVLQKLCEKYPAISRSKVIGHENVSITKSDPGPLFPLQTFRKAVFDGEQVSTASLIKETLMFSREYAGALPDETYLRKELVTDAKFGPAAKLVMGRLGYADSSKWSIRAFQRMMKIGVDGIAGPVTLGKLYERCRSRRSSVLELGGKGSLI